MKKNNLLKFLTVFFCVFATGIFTYAQNPNCFRITFTDKDNSPYAIERPDEFLSQRAINKRVRFEIPITEQDFPVNPQYVQNIQSFFNTITSVIATSKWNNSVVLHCPEVDNWQTIVDQIKEKFSYVKEVLPVAYYDLSKKVETPLPEQISNAIVYRGSCDYNYGKSIDNIKIHNGQLLHKAGFCGEDMLICVLDVGWTAFDLLSVFKPLFENGQIWGTRDLIPGVNDVYTGHSHGTSITSEMVCNIDGVMVGTAPKANYFFIRSDDPWREQLIEEDFYAQACEIADSLGADISTASLGYTTFDFEWQNIYTPDDNIGTASIASRAATTLAEKGVIVVNSAGNEGNGLWRYLGRPADAFNILAVGAVNKDGVIAGFSSYGPSADGRVKPDVASVGDGAWMLNTVGGAMQGSGTSCSAPIIAGLAACLWQALPQYSSSQMMQLIREYGDCFSNPNDRKGYGIPNFYKIYSDITESVTEEESSNFSVYPNPTTGQLRIESNKGINPLVSVEIFDIMGKKISSHHLIPTSPHHLIPSSSHHLIPSSSPHLDISHLSAGVYFVKIHTENGAVVRKVIKQ